MGLSTVCRSVRAVFFVTFGSLAAQGTSFVSQIVLGFDMRCERRKSMAEIDLNGEIHQKTKKRHAKTQNPWHAKMQHLPPARGILKNFNARFRTTPPIDTSELILFHSDTKSDTVIQVMATFSPAKKRFRAVLSPPIVLGLSLGNLAPGGDRSV